MRSTDHRGLLSTNRGPLRQHSLKGRKWRDPNLRPRLQQRPLSRCRVRWLDGGNGRKAEGPVLGAPVIRRDVVWPKADRPISAARCAKPDIAALSLPA